MRNRLFLLSPFVVMVVALVSLTCGFSNPETTKRPGRDLPKDDKLRIGIVKRVEVSG